jgi:ABC-type spermidine/putrescine transport system permease subunit II
VDALLHLPILVLVASSFNDSKFSAGWVGFTLDWYCRLLGAGTSCGASRPVSSSVAPRSSSARCWGALVALAPYRCQGRIYGMVRRSIEPSINAISTIILLVTTTLIYLADRPAREQ